MYYFDLRIRDDELVRRSLEQETGKAVEQDVDDRTIFSEEETQMLVENRDGTLENWENEHITFWVAWSFEVCFPVQLSVQQY